MAWYWTALLLAFLLAFAVGEGWALKTGRMTLSRYVWTISKYFPAFPFICGFVVGFLACHFWWGGIVPFATVQ